MRTLLPWEAALMGGLGLGLLCSSSPEASAPIVLSWGLVPLCVLFFPADWELPRGGTVSPSERTSLETEASLPTDLPEVNSGGPLPDGDSLRAQLRDSCTFTPTLNIQRLFPFCSLDQITSMNPAGPLASAMPLRPLNDLPPAWVMGGERLQAPWKAPCSSSPATQHGMLLFPQSPGTG